MSEERKNKIILKDDLLSKVTGGQDDGTAYAEYQEDENLMYFYDNNNNCIGSRPPLPGELDYYEKYFSMLD